MGLGDYFIVASLCVPEIPKMASIKGSVHLWTHSAFTDHAGKSIKLIYNLFLQLAAISGKQQVFSTGRSFGNNHHTQKLI